MPEIPSFFNKRDFFGILLPGYVAVTLYLSLFQPDLILNRGQKIEADLFSIVLLLIAGPVLGSILRAIHRFFFAIRYGITRDEGKKKERAQRLLEYARVRVYCRQEELAELDDTDSEYNFRVSTALAVTIIALYYLWNKYPLSFEEMFVVLLMIVVGGMLFYGGYIVYRQRWTQIFQILNDEASKMNKVKFIYDTEKRSFKLV